MIIFNPYAIPPLISATIIIFAGIIIFRKNPRAEINLIFFTQCILTAIWQTFYSINYLVTSQNTFNNELLLRLGYCAVAFLPIGFAQYLIEFLEVPPRRKILFFNLFYGLIICILIIKTNLIVDHIHKYFWGFYPIAGKFHPFFLIKIGIEITYLNFILLTRLKSKSIHSNKLAQLKYMFLGYFIYTIACWDFIPNYNIELYPIGYIPATLFILITFYAIYKHNLLDINLVINKGLVYSILISSITLLYLLLVILSERFSQNIFHYNSLIISLFASIIIAISFVPLKDQIQLLVDRFFLRKTPFELASENQALRATAAQSEKMRILATLSSGIAHEIRNPLTSLKTFIEYFPKKKNDPEFVAKFESIAGSEVARIENILNDLLTFAKPSPLTLTDTDINKIIQHALNLTSNQLKKNNIELKTELADDLPLIKADANKLIQVFINLILNAIDAMPSGGVLTIASRFTDDVSRDRVSIAIADTGCGIPKENLSKIFDPFFSTKDTGTGLGLAIVKGIIEEHGGKISIASNQEKGTAFSISLSLKNTVIT